LTVDTVLVLTTVHHPDDPRIREKLIRTLGGHCKVLFAARQPGPHDRSGLEWLPLRGGRLARNLSAWRIALSRRYDLLSLHDPETLPLGLMVSLVRGKRVVFDVHENIPEQIKMRTWVAPVLRPWLAKVASLLLRWIERRGEVTLAEPGYQTLFRAFHPVFPNYLPSDLPEVLEARSGYAVYVGDVTPERGLTTAVVAAAAAGCPLRVVGRVDPAFQTELESTAARAGGEVSFIGRLPHPEAMDVARQAVVGLSPLRDLPNYRHSLPTKILEYLALGVPVVATDLPGTRAALSGLEAVELVPPDQVDEMAAAIGRSRLQMASAVAQAGSVRSRFSWPAADLLDFYLGRTRPGPAPHPPM
jgi:glycosyltransferase involved in cell wall biosynthesis